MDVTSRYLLPAMLKTTRPSFKMLAVPKSALTSAGVSHLALSAWPCQVIQEGVDCVIRTGSLDDSTLVAYRLGELRWLTCAAPSYLKEYGVPTALEHLQRHHAVHFLSSTMRRGNEFHFIVDGVDIAVPIQGAIAVNETDLYIKLSLDGLGLIQLAEVLVADRLEAGELVEVLPTSGRRLCRCRCYIPIAALYRLRCAYLPIGQRSCSLIKPGLFVRMGDGQSSYRKSTL